VGNLKRLFGAYYWNLCKDRLNEEQGHCDNIFSAPSRISSHES
jgi:hypothetical protein